MSLNGLQSTQFPLTLDGLSSLDVSSLTIDGQDVNLAGLVPYTGANQTVDLGTQIIRTTHTATTNPELVNLGLLNTTISNLSIAISGSFLDKTTATPQTVAGNVSYTAQLSADDLLVPATKKASLGSVLTVDANYRRSETDATVSTVQYFGSISSSMGIYEATSTQNFAILQVADLGAGTGKRMDINWNLNINEASYNSSIQLFASDNGNTINQYLGPSVSFTPSDPLYKVMTGFFVPVHRYICVLCITAKPSGVQTVRWYGLQLEEQGVDITALTMSAQGASQIPILNDKKQLVGSGVSSSKVVFLDNCSEDIQTALNNRLNLSGSNANQDIVLGGYKVQSSATPTTGNDLTNKTYVDGAIATGTATIPRKADVRTGVAPNAQPGATMSFYFGTHTNNNIAPFSDMLLLNGWTDSSAGSVNLLSFSKGAKGIRQYQGAYGSASAFSTYYDCVMTDANSGNVTLSGTLALGANKATSSANPSTDDDLCRKGYVDTQDALRVAKSGDTMSGDLTVSGSNGITVNGGTVNTGILASRFYLSARGDNQDSVGNDNIYGPWYGLGDSGIPNFLNKPCLTGFYGCAMRSGLGFLILDENGRVGIGTTNTGTFALTVSGTSSFGGDVSLGANKATCSATPTTNDDLTRKGYVDSGLALKGNLAGGNTWSDTQTFNGTVAVSNRLLGLPDSSPNGNFWMGLRGSGTEADRLAISINGDYTTGAVAKVVIGKALRLSHPTADRVLTVDSSGDVVSSSVTPTVLSYLDIGSSLSGLLNLKANLAGPQTFSGTHTFNSATPINLSGLTAERVITLDGSKNIATSAVTTTELGYLSGTVSSVQNQLNGKLNDTGDTATGIIYVDIANTYAQRATNPLPSNFVAKSSSQRLYMGAYYTSGVGACSTIQSSDYYSSADHGTNLLLNPLGGSVGFYQSSPQYVIHASLTNDWDASVGSYNTNKARGIIALGGKNNDPDYQYLLFSNPSKTDGGVAGMAWWSSDMIVGRYKNEFRLAWWKETHGSPLGTAYKEGITLFLTDSSGYTTLDWIKMTGKVGIGTTASPSTLLYVNGTGGFTDTLSIGISGLTANTTPNLIFSSSAQHVDDGAGQVYLFSAINGHIGIQRNTTRNATTACLTLGTADTEESQVISYKADGSGFMPLSYAGSKHTLVGGPVNVAGTTPSAVPNGFMAKGSLTIGSITENYGGFSSGWATNTAGLLMECLNNTEIAIHDSGQRVASFCYFQGGSTNTFTIGRDMGWGKTPTEVSGRLQCSDVVGIGLPSTSTYQAPIARFTINSSYIGGDTGCFAINAFDGTAYNLRLFPYVQAGGQVAYLFKTYNQGTPYDSLAIGYNGNIGIKTTSPDYPLDVNASGRVRGNLYVGTEGTNGATIFMGGPAGDAGYDHCQIKCRTYNGTYEGSELVLFKGNDPNAGSLYPDRIRIRANALAFDTHSGYSTDPDAESIRMVLDQNGRLGLGDLQLMPQVPDNGTLNINRSPARTGTHGTGLALYVTNGGNAIAEFRDPNGTQGIGIGYNRIYGVAPSGNQNLELYANGTGELRHEARTHKWYANGSGLSPATMELLSDGMLQVSNAVSIIGNTTTTNSNEFRLRTNGPVFVAGNAWGYGTGGNGVLQVGAIQSSDFSGRAQDSISCRAWNDANYIISFHNTSGTNRGFIGGVNSSSVSYNTSSDRRLKDNVHHIEGSLNIINRLQPVHFRWIKDDEYDFGFIAQDVYKVLPHMRPNLTNYIKECSCKREDICNGKQCEHCQTMNDEPVDEDGNPRYYSLDYGRFTPYLVGAVQEQQKQIEDLNARVKVLEAREAIWVEHAREQEAKQKKMEERMEKMASLISQLMARV